MESEILDLGFDIVATLDIETTHFSFDEAGFSIAATRVVSQ
jgi:hypothetical protein